MPLADKIIAGILLYGVLSLAAAGIYLLAQRGTW